MDLVPSAQAAILELDIKFEFLHRVDMLIKYGRLIIPYSHLLGGPAFANTAHSVAHIHLMILPDLVLVIAGAPIVLKALVQLFGVRDSFECDGRVYQVEFTFTENARFAFEC